jgi:hypothetical protein
VNLLSLVCNRRKAQQRLRSRLVAVAEAASEKQEMLMLTVKQSPARKEVEAAAHLPRSRGKHPAKMGIRRTITGSPLPVTLLLMMKMRMRMRMMKRIWSQTTAQYSDGRSGGGASASLCKAM